MVLLFNIICHSCEYLKVYHSAKEYGTVVLQLLKVIRGAVRKNYRHTLSPWNDALSKDDRVVLGVGCWDRVGAGLQPSERGMIL